MNVRRGESPHLFEYPGQLTRVVVGETQCRSIRRRVIGADDDGDALHSEGRRSGGCARLNGRSRESGNDEKKAA